MKASFPQSRGFLHRGHRIFALEYQVEPHDASASAYIIVWLNEQGGALNGNAWHSDPNKWIVTAKAGDTIIVNGKAWKVLGVRVYRGEGMCQYG